MVYIPLPRATLVGRAECYKPFYASVASGSSIPFNLLKARQHFCIFRNFTFCRNPLINYLDWIPKRGEILWEPNINFVDEKGERSARKIPLLVLEKEWFLNILLADFIYQRNGFVDIQAYTLSRFAVQIGFEQGVVGSPGSLSCRYVASEMPETCGILL